MAEQKPYLQLQTSFDLSYFIDFQYGYQKYLHYKGSTAPHVHHAEEYYKQGSMKVFLYKAEQERASIVLIPSLINKSYILDLKDNSLIEYLNNRGYNVFLVDWQEPLFAEHSFNLSDYVEKRLLPLLEDIAKVSQNKIFIGGYCLGGLLALACNQLMQNLFSGVILLATPWSFEQNLPPQYELTISKYIDNQKIISKEFLNHYFLFASPEKIIQKFINFAYMEPENSCFEKFLSVENWLNDGIDITRNVARDCLLSLRYHNDFANGRWKVADQVITTESIRKLPVFLGCGRQDSIVPINSALNIAEGLKKAHIQQIDAGHIGTIIGSKAKENIWQDLYLWLKELV